jgi:UDP-glucose 4-epimerase
MAHYLVTGGAGFIGSNLVEALIKKGERVRVVDDFSTGKRANVKPFLSGVELVEGSIADLDLCRRATKDVDFVLHQGAIPSVPKSVELPRETNEANVAGTLNMLVAARDAKVKRFVFAASSSAYGDTPELPKKETMTPTPKSPYAIQKLTGELYCRVFFEQYGLETVSIRYFNVFGPRQDPTSQYGAVIPKFVTAYIQDEQPVVFGDGSQSRDFTYIDNVVHANLLACTADRKCAGQVMNVACGERITLLELAKAIREELGRTKLPRHEAPRAGDVMHSHADIARARALLGFEPQVLFREGMKKTIEWYKANKSAWST